MPFLKGQGLNSLVPKINKGGFIMNKFIYPAIFITEEEGYSVIFPDLEGCHTQGDTLEEALDMAKDALSLYIFDMVEDKKEIPKASNPKDVKVDDDSFISIIEFDLLEYQKKYDSKAVKKTLSIPNWLNIRAEEAHINFSQLLQSALKKELNV